MRPEAQSRRVSICIVTYRRPRYLQACLESLSRLRFSKAPAPQLTVVVVDNDAEGGAGPLVRALGPAFPWRVDYAVEPRRGISWARNTALRLAQRHGDWIAFIDDDEIADPAWLDELLAAVEEYGVKVVTGPVIRLLPQDTAPWLLKGRFFDMKRAATGTRELTAKTGNVLFHQDVLGGDPEPFEGRFALTGGGDGHFFRKVTVRGHAIVWCDEALVHETVPASRMTTGWIVDRTFRSALNYHRSMFSFFPPLRLAPGDLAKAVAKLLLGTGQLLLLGLTAKHRRVQGLCWIAAGAGTFAAYLGIVADGYHRIQGE